jgi:hypothetical protein
LDLSGQPIYTFDFTRYPELDTLDISNNKNLLKADLSKCDKLKYLDVSNSPRLGVIHNLEDGYDISDIIFGENKKSLEEFHFINVIASFDLEEFTNLKKISYGWNSGQITLNKNLKGKIKILYPS